MRENKTVRDESENFRKIAIKEMNVNYYYGVVK